MRVGFFCDVPELGGAELSVLDYLRYLPDFGIEGLAITTRESLFAAKAREAAGRCIVIRARELVEYERRLNLFKATRNPVRWLKYFWQAISTCRRIAEAVRINQIDIIHTNSLRAHVYGSLISLFSGRPLVWHMRDVITKPWVRLLLTVAGTRARVIIAVSGPAAQSIWIRRRVRILGNSIDLAALHNGEEYAVANPETVETQRNFPLVAIFGQLVPWKGQADFITAARLLRPSLRYARFLIVGDSLMNDPAFKEGLVRRIRDEQLDDMVCLTGFRSDAIEIMRRVDIVVSASWHEPRGRTIMEAMALGKPVIATRSGGTPELIEDGTDGILIRPHRPDELAEAILSLVANPDLRRRVGLQASAKATAKFDLRTEVASLIKVYENVG